MHARPLDAFAATLVFALCVLAGWLVFGETQGGRRRNGAILA
jgi:hypothetical protein